jgi:membrane protease YdiL (CAAX protease family)
MSSAWIRPAIGVAIAIGITTAMDATGLTQFSALPLFPLFLLGWYLERLPRSVVGFRGAAPRDFGLALLHPIAVLGVLTAVALLAGAADPQAFDLRAVAGKVARIGFGTFIVVTVTEEGFFRGWLWASLERAGASTERTLWYTSVAFALWHVSWVTLPAESRLPPAQVPLFLLNAALLGLIWGLLRAASGSIVVASAAHGLWNGIDYVLFGYGPRPGILGIRATSLYGPEVGILGVVVNLAFALLLWKYCRARAVSLPNGGVQRVGAGARTSGADPSQLPP